MNVFSTLFKYFFNSQNNDQGSTNDASQEEVGNLQAGSDQQLQQEQQQQQPTSSDTYNARPLQNIIDLTLDDDDDEVGNQANDDPDGDVPRRGCYELYRHRSIARSRRTERRRLLLTKKNSENKCLDCKIEFVDIRGSLSRLKCQGLCVGCYNLKKVVQGEEATEDMRRWLCTGELSLDEWKTKAPGFSSEIKLGRRAKRMKRRQGSRPVSSVKVSEGEFPSKECLQTLYLNSQCKCAVTGWLVPLVRRQRFWSATFDHIIPVSAAPDGMNPWTIDNIQVLSYTINQVKSNHSQAEIRRCYQQWLSTNSKHYS